MEQLTLLGVRINPLTIEELNEIVNQAIRSNERWIIANHNLHSIFLYHHDKKMQAFYEKAYVIHIDGMPLILWARLLGNQLRINQRVTYLDWIFPLMELAWKNSWRVFYLGGKPGVAEKSALTLCRRFHGLQIKVHHGYFDRYRQNTQILENINKYYPQILIVGMGMPIQEHWVLENSEHLNTNVILTAGACFDYIAGVIPTPPRWMGRLGLEWLYRLLSEPRRLARRYLVEPWSLVPWAIRDIRERYFSKSENYQRN